MRQAAHERTAKACSAAHPLLLRTLKIRNPNEQAKMGRRRASNPFVSPAEYTLHPCSITEAILSSE